METFLLKSWRRSSSSLVSCCLAVVDMLAVHFFFSKWKLSSRQRKRIQSTRISTGLGGDIAYRSRSMNLRKIFWEEWWWSRQVINSCMQGHSCITTGKIQRQGVYNLKAPTGTWCVKSSFLALKWSCFPLKKDMIISVCTPPDLSSFLTCWFDLSLIWWLIIMIVVPDL